MAAVPYMREQAAINVTNAQAAAIQKWNGAIPALPASVTTEGQGWIDTLLSYLGFICHHILVLASLRAFVPTVHFWQVMPFLLAFFGMFSTMVFIYNLRTRVRSNLLDVIVLCAAGALLAWPLLVWLPAPAPASWPYLAASVAIHVLYFALVGLGYRSADMSFIYPLTRGSAPLFTAILAFALLGEAPKLSGWLGVALLCVGVITLALDGHRAANVPARAWVIGFSNAVIIVAYTVIDGAGVRLSGNAWSYVLWQIGRAHV